MAEFLIIKNQSDEYKEQIIEFWKDYLPGTPSERFDWMKNGNPAGSAVWFLAFPKDSNELAGTISIMPKEMMFNHKKIRAGIVGDYMVSSKHRVFGPGLLLLRTVMQSLPELDLKFIYTIPNSKSEKLVNHVGFEDKGRIYYVGKHITIDNYLDKYIGAFGGKLVGFFIEQIIKVLSKETYLSSTGFFERVANIDEFTFDGLWQRVMNTKSGIIGNHSGKYISWRYLRNPRYKFQVLTYRKTQSSDLLGYVVFAITHEKLDIYDIVTADDITISKLLKEVINVAREFGCNTIYSTMFPNNPLLKRLKRYQFWDSKYEMKLYCFGKTEYLDQVCLLFAGDRNE